MFVFGGYQRGMISTLQKPFLTEEQPVTRPQRRHMCGPQRWVPATPTPNREGKFREVLVWDEPRTRAWMKQKFPN